MCDNTVSPCIRLTLFITYCLHRVLSITCPEDIRLFPCSSCLTVDDFHSLPRVFWCYIFITIDIKSNCSHLLKGFMFLVSEVFFKVLSQCSKRSINPPSRRISLQKVIEVEFLIQTICGDCQT